ncbi:MAG TPA: BON domain-containing protein [Gemmataceae bacterium]|jgi:osmotically-inducible protein OsmY
MILAATQAERSDLLHDAVLAALRSSGYRLLWDLECEVRDDLVTLTGVLPSFYLKQMAQTIAMGVDQVREVRNGVEVEPD